MGFSIRNHPAMGYPNLWNHPCVSKWFSRLSVCQFEETDRTSFVGVQVRALTHAKQLGEQGQTQKHQLQVTTIFFQFAEKKSYASECFRFLLFRNFKFSFLSSTPPCCCLILVFSFPWVLQWHVAPRQNSQLTMLRRGWDNCLSTSRTYAIDAI